MDDIVLPKMLTQSFDLFIEPIFVVSKDSRILHANLPSAKLCGFRTSDGLNEKYYEEVKSSLFEDENIIQHWKNQDLAIVKNPLKGLKMLEIHPGTADSPYIVRKMPLYNEGRECVGVIHHIKYIEIFRPNDFIKGKLPGSLLLNKPDEFFTEKECEIIFLKLQGMRSKSIAEILCRSPRTIEHALERLYNKAGVNHIDDFISFCEQRDFHRYLPHKFLQSKRVAFENGKEICE